MEDDAYRPDAQLLFETVKSFRAIRDHHRLGKLARALSLITPPHEDPTIHEMQKLINRLGGKSFGTYEANYIVAQEIQGMIRDLGLRIACPRAGCQKPATLHCTRNKSSKNGIFFFVHCFPGGQVHHGGWCKLPEEMQLTRAKPVSRKLAR